MKAVLRAELKHPDARVQELHLFQIEPKVLRWVTMPAGRLWDGVDYLDDRMAIKALRVTVDTDPAYVGVDLTILPMDPTPAELTAREIGSLIDRPDHAVQPYTIQAIAEIIERSTNINGVLSAFNDLIAHCFTRRPAYAKALFPTVAGREPRDLVLDGLLLASIEQIEKATGQKFDSLRKILAEPVSQISVAHHLPKPPSGRTQ